MGKLVVFYSLKRKVQLFPEEFCVTVTGFKTNKSACHRKRLRRQGEGQSAHRHAACDSTGAAGCQGNGCSSRGGECLGGNVWVLYHFFDHRSHVIDRVSVKFSFRSK